MYAMMIETCPKCYAVPFPTEYITFMSRSGPLDLILVWHAYTKLKLLKYFRKEKHDFRRAVLSGAGLFVHLV